MPRSDRHHTAQYGTVPRRLAGWCLAVLCCSQAAFAQSVVIAPSDPKRWDVTGSIGWLAGDKSDIAEEWNDWYDTFATSLDVGRYWTPHVKTEAAVTFTTEGGVFARQQPFIPGGGPPIYIPREHHFRVTAFSATATYQFLENTWVHPFLTAGVQFTEERERAFSIGIPYSGRDFSPIDVPIEPPRQATVFSVRPIATGGAKFYVNERGFVRTDLGVAWHHGRVAQVTWRAGIGVDF
jgi:opacity protein-like surface antigen